MSDDIPDAVEQPPWRTSDGPKPAVHTYSRPHAPALQIRIHGEWRTATVIGRQQWADGKLVYQVEVTMTPGSTVHRSYHWPQPGLRLPDADALLAFQTRPSRRQRRA